MDKFLAIKPNATKAPTYRTSSPKNKPLVKVASYKKRIGTAALKDHNKTSKNNHKGDKPFKIYEDCDSKEVTANSETPVTEELVDEECQTESSPCFCSCHALEKNGAELSLDLGSSIVIDPEEEVNRMKIQEEVPDDYWHWVGVAHSKTEALNETMEEAIQLADEVDKLKQENAHLSKVAEYSFYFASVLESLLDDTPEDSGIAEVSKCLAKYKNLTQDQSSIIDASNEAAEVQTKDGPKDESPIESLPEAEKTDGH